MHSSRMSNADPDLRASVLPMGAACYALQARRTANLLSRAYNQALAGLDLEVAQFSTLCVIVAGRTTSVADMAEQLGVDRSTLVRNLKILQRRGLIAPRGRDGRRAVYGLTPDGEAVLARALPRWRAMQDAVDRALSVDRGADPRRAMGALRRAVGAAVPVGDPK